MNSVYSLPDPFILEKNFISLIPFSNTGRKITLYRITKWIDENFPADSLIASHKLGLAIDCNNDVYLIHKTGPGSNNCWLFDDLKDPISHKYLLIEYQLYKRNKTLNDILLNNGL